MTDISVSDDYTGAAGTFTGRMHRVMVGHSH
jgi:hypothetical protein